MAVKIRLRRTGARNQPSYRIVVVDSRKKRDGKYIEHLGYYDPKQEPFIYKVNIDRAIYWLDKGAIPTTTAKALLRKAGVLEKRHILKFGSKAEKEIATPATESVASIEKLEEKIEQTPEEQREEKTNEEENNEGVD